MKKLLFIVLVCVTTAAFSQKKLQKLTAAPNPFHTSTTISFTSSESTPVLLIVKNVLGKTVYQKSFTTTAGKNTLTFYKNDLQSGMYIYAIRSRKEVISKRFVIK